MNINQNIFNSTMKWLRVTNSRIRITAVGIFLIIILEIYQWVVTGKFDWPTVIIILELYIFILMWLKYPLLSRLFGEDDKVQLRLRFRLSIALFLFSMFLIPFSFYYLKGLVSGPIDPIGQISIIVLALSLGGICFAAARIPGITSEKRQQIIFVGQKFVLCVIPFVIFAPLIYMIDTFLGGIDPNSFKLANLVDVTALTRGLYFWLAVPCFYGGMALFFFALVDLILVLPGLDVHADNG